MSILKRYEIKGLGIYNISQFKKRFEITPEQIVEPGFYGNKGALTVTGKCETLEQAQTALMNAIYEEIGNEQEKLLARQNTLDGIERKLFNGIDQFLIEK